MGIAAAVEAAAVAVQEAQFVTKRKSNSGGNYGDKRYYR